MKDLIDAFILLLPAMVANMVATPAGKFGGHYFPQFGPIDRGALYYDKRPVLGVGKTWAGLLGGMLAAGFLACGAAYALNRHGQAHLWFTIGVLVGLGALGGDLAKSFVKRRLNFGKDSCMPVADQTDFILGAGVVYLVLQSLPYLGSTLASLPWFLSPTGFWYVCFGMLVAHPLVNRIAFCLGWKRVPY